MFEPYPFIQGILRELYEDRTIEEIGIEAS